MIITLNQKEIERMILRGLADMGIPHDDATITMVAGRSPAGMTAEVKLTPQETPPIPVGALPQETFSGEGRAPVLETTNEEYGGNNPDGVDAMKEETEKTEDKPEKKAKKVKADAPLFGANAKSA